MNWFEISNLSEVPSPSLLIYADPPKVASGQQ